MTMDSLWDSTVKDICFKCKEPKGPARPMTDDEKKKFKGEI